MAVSIDIRDMTDTRATFVVEGVHPYFVNALRRVLLAEVPKLALDEITFYDNTSALFDEIIAHRLSLLPVPTDPATLNLAGRVDDEGNPEYVVRFRLTKEGPCTVYSGDMECDDPAFHIADDKIPIVTLLEGQRLILEATAILGQGTEHAKWQVCHGAGYKYYPTAHLDNGKISDELRATALEVTPKGILAVEDGKLVIADPERVDHATAAASLVITSGANAGKTLSQAGGFQIEHDDRKFIFQFETDGSLKAEDALMKAVEILKDRFKDFGDNVDLIGA